VNYKVLMLCAALWSGGASASIQQLSIPWAGLPVQQWLTSQPLAKATLDGYVFKQTYSTTLYPAYWDTVSDYWIFDGTEFTFGTVHAPLVCPPPSPVPLPAAAWLFCMSIVSLIVVGRRRYK
jgi:hypothetical protein